MLIDFAKVTKTYAAKDGPVNALANVTLQIDAGQFIAVRGASGCGKSTLLLAAGGLLRPTSGTVTVAGQNVYELTSEKRAAFRAAQIGFVFQQFHLIPYLTVLDNILTASLAAPSDNAKTRCEELIERFNLSHRKNHTPGKLSTGEKQRTALARALLNEPRVLLADEPTGNLDPENADIVLESLKSFANQGGAVLLVTHDGRASDVADETKYLDAGSFK